MNYILDTHILIWWAEDNKLLRPEFKKIISDSTNTIFVSVASVWEVIIKTKLKKIKLQSPIEKIVDKYGFNYLDIKLSHVLGQKKLKDYHKDPFDRILIAQSIAEKMILLTDDKLVRRYLDY
jgi:PIN domain nuclease of toxin-antitoxin system